MSVYRTIGPLVRLYNKQVYDNIQKIIIGYSTVFCKIWDFICTSISSAENSIGRAIVSPMWFSAERIQVQIKSHILQNTFE